MGIWTIQGGNRLYGTIQVQGARNGVLPILAACLVHKDISVLERVPRVVDVDRMLEILVYLGCKVRREGTCVTIDSRYAEPKIIPRNLMEPLRASVLILGAMSARFGEGRIAMPRYGSIGPRPIDLHLSALSQLGGTLTLTEDEIICGGKLVGGHIYFPYPSVGATEQAMLAACGCCGMTVLHHCAKDPAIEDLAQYMNRMGVKIIGAGTDTIQIIPGKYIGTVYHAVIADRVAAGTLLCAAAACGGKITLQDINCTHLHPVLDGLEEMGCNIKIREQSVTLQSTGDLWSPSYEIVTGPYPRFPSDMQPMILAAALCADGVTVVREHVFAGRLKHARQLRKFGADISFGEDCTAYVTGVDALHGAYAEARDIRGGAALLVAALQARGESCIVDAGHISRGYEFFDATLRQLGAEIEYSD